MTFKLVYDVTAGGCHLQFLISGEVHHGMIKVTRKTPAFTFFCNVRVVNDDVTLTRMAVSQDGFAADDKFATAGRFQVGDFW